MRENRREDFLTYQLQFTFEEVKIEELVMAQGRGIRADYAFYTAPNFAQARFIAEANKPISSIRKRVRFLSGDPLWLELKHADFSFN